VILDGNRLEDVVDGVVEGVGAVEGEGHEGVEGDTLAALRAGDKGFLHACENVVDYRGVRSSVLLQNLLLGLPPNATIKVVTLNRRAFLLQVLNEVQQKLMSVMLVNRLKFFHYVSP